MNETAYKQWMHDLEYQFRLFQADATPIPDIIQKLAQWAHSTQNQYGMLLNASEAREWAQEMVFLHHPEFAPLNYSLKHIKSHHHQEEMHPFLAEIDDLYSEWNKREKLGTKKP